MCFYEPYKPTRNVGIIQPPGAGFSVQPVLVQQYSIPDSGNTFIPETKIVAVQFYQQFYLLQSGDFVKKSSICADPADWSRALKYQFTESCIAERRV